MDLIHFQFKLHIRIYVNFIHLLIFIWIVFVFVLLSFYMWFWTCVLWFFDLKSEFIALASYQPELQCVIINLRKGGFFIIYSSILISILMIRVLLWISFCRLLFYFSFLTIFGFWCCCLFIYLVFFFSTSFLADVCVSNNLSTVV